MCSGLRAPRPRSVPGPQKYPRKSQNFCSIIDWRAWLRAPGRPWMPCSIQTGRSGGRGLTYPNIVWPFCCCSRAHLKPKLDSDWHGFAQGPGRQHVDTVHTDSDEGADREGIQGHERAGQTPSAIMMYRVCLDFLILEIERRTSDHRHILPDKPCILQAR